MEHNKHTNIEYFISEDIIPKLPQFSKAIFKYENIEDKEKIKFRDLFLFKYLSDEEFRAKYQNTRLIFVYNKLYGIQFGDGPLKIDDVEGYQILRFRITDDPPDYFINKSVNLKILHGINYIRVESNF